MGGRRAAGGFSVRAGRARPRSLGVTGRTRDVVLVLVLAATASLMSWQNGGRVGAALDVRGPSPGGYDDIWFDADTRDLHRRITFDNYQQTHTARHPLV